MNYLDFKGKKAVVTGTSGLLGPIWVETLRELGCTVAGIDYPQCDISNQDELDEFTNAILAVYTPDILIHNAGVDAPPSKGATANFWGEKYIMDVNYFGGVAFVKAFWDAMKKKEGIKHVIFIGSLLGNVAADHRNYSEGFDKPVTYGSSKRALYALVQNLATRGASHNILVNMLSFSMVDGKGITDEFKGKYLKNVPMGRPIYKDDLKRALVGLLIQSYKTGKEDLIDGGYTAW
jgi:NAD(P)-dependent dehydrogenase (short-subunit alcohol dehydrogenase family)